MIKIYQIQCPNCNVYIEEKTDMTTDITTAICKRCGYFYEKKPKLSNTGIKVGSWQMGEFVPNYVITENKEPYGCIHYMLEHEDEERYASIRNEEEFEQAELEIITDDKVITAEVHIVNSSYAGYIQTIK
jgi:hypothetical protein